MQLCTNFHVFFFDMKKFAKCSRKSLTSVLRNTVVIFLFLSEKVTSLLENTIDRR